MTNGDDIRDVLFRLKVWFEFRLANGPTVTRGECDPSGHPHTWAGVVIPDWDIKQKIAEIEQSLKPTEEKKEC